VGNIFVKSCLAAAAMAVAVAPLAAQSTRTYTGSGFVVAPGRVVTNHHVIADCDAIWVAQRQRVQARLKIASAQQDLALLELSAELPGTESAPIRASAVLGEDVLVAGYPLSGLLSSDLIVTSGIVNALTGLRDAAGLMQISAQVQPGNSGGPVLDRKGAVVGVVVSKLNAVNALRVTGDIPQNINFAIKPDVLKAFLAAAKVVTADAAASSTRLDGADLAARARTYTVGIECTRSEPDGFEPLRDSIKTLQARSSEPPIPSFADAEARLQYLHWVGAMSAKLKDTQTDWLERKEFLQTVWFESRRAGLSPALVLSMIEQLSRFRKFHTTVIDARGYMSLLSGVTKWLGDGDATALFHMQTNLRYGCVLLRHYLDRNRGDVRAAVAQYLAEVSLNKPPRDKEVVTFTRAILTARQKWRYLPGE
jgi:soluble lytic murein transglycosylase-like protein